MKMKVKNGIINYFHCKNCFENNVKDKIAVGWTEKGFQVWCDQCDTDVIAIDFNGNKVTLDTSLYEEIKTK